MISIYSGIDHIVSNVTDLFELKAKNRNGFVIHLVARLNGVAHLGTLINFATGFVLASRLKEIYGKPAWVHVELIDNISDPKQNETLYYGGKVYFLQKNIRENFRLQTNQDKFVSLLDKLVKITEVGYDIQNYQDIQADVFVRRTIVEVINDSDYFGLLFQPSDKKLHYRVPCPVCGLIEKTSTDTKLVSKTYEELLIRSRCPLHGVFETLFTPNNDSYIDINIPFRNFCKGVSVVDKDVVENTLSVIVRGNDWSGNWPLRIYCEGLLRLNRRSLPDFLFSPLVLHRDKKLSKSKIEDSGLYKGFVDINLLSFEQIQIIVREVNCWMDNTSCFFANYTTDYFDEILKKDKYEKHVQV